jgi:Leucine-rich repeat (LRR) protein
MKERKSNIIDRLTYLAENFDVFENFEDKLKELEENDYTTKVIKGVRVSVLAIVSTKDINTNRLYKKKVSISSDVFSDMIVADPTENKMFIQWMLNVFTRFLKDDKEQSIQSAIRFADEDLPQANTYLTLFEANKRKNKFKELAKTSYSVKNLLDPTDINQYKSLAQLFDAVYPFIDKDPSEIEFLMQKFVDAKQASIPVKDRNFTLFIPKTRDANVIFDKFANWCTAKPDNGMFKTYTENNRKPNGVKSSIYIIINNKFYSGDSDEIYQIHFETNQIKDKSNKENVSIFEKVISESQGISNYFHEELMLMAKQNNCGIDDNIYIEALMKFGFAESLFEFLDDNTPIIRIEDKEIPKLPDLTKFLNLDTIVITNAKLIEIHPSIGKLQTLETISLTNNNIKSLPKEIGSLKNLLFLNLKGNPIEEFPDEIKFLDKVNGGNLHRLNVNINDIGVDNYNKLKVLLPTTLI